MGNENSKPLTRERARDIIIDEVRYFIRKNQMKGSPRYDKLAF
jgi:hypothetical protein